jgi:pyridoxamine 5'-phosphate oxidase
MRRGYEGGGLSEADLAGGWLAQLRRWLADAVRAGLLEPNAMVLATAAADARPRARTVLLKGLDEQGLVWFTNFDSRKGRDLAANPYAAVCFPWVELSRQVHAEGPVTRLPAAQTAAYFRTRPPGSRLGAWASPQSQVISGRAELDERVAAARARFGGGADAQVPVPPHWGGYRLAPESVEFWQGRADRLHDRLRYRRDPAGGWLVERLAP